MVQEDNSGKRIRTLAHVEKILEIVRDELVKKPPTIGLVGVSGVGKSSTINAMFKTDLPTSDTVACTKTFQSTDVDLELVQGEAKSTKTVLRVYDAPGLGEDISKDDEYLEMYKKWLPECDVVLWVMSARQRAVALDQQYLKILAPLHSKFVFGINQVDLVEPRDWVESVNLPSREQETNSEIIRRDRLARISDVLGHEPPMVCYSAKHGYQLLKLFTVILESCPSNRAWIFHGLRNFDPHQFQRITWTGSGGLLSRLFRRKS